MRIEEIMKKMINFSKGNHHDINHFMKVHSYARTIGLMEGLDEETQYLLEASAIVHDIACPLCRAKYGNTAGNYQEAESEALLRTFFDGTDIREEHLERIIHVVSHHHTYTGVDGADWQILLEADYLVNADESERYRKSLAQFREKVFRTASGLSLLDSVFRNEMSNTLPEHKLIDITLKITPAITKDAQTNLQKALVGHLGTHFDVMNKEFPLEYTRRKGIVFDIRSIRGRDVEIADIDISAVEKDMFVVFCSGFQAEEPYGTKPYFSTHPQLSNELIDALLERGISIIGIDFAGVRNGKEHTPMDQHCADHGVFIVENLCHLEDVLEAGGRFTAHTYPMNYAGYTGLPCRVVAEV